MYIHRKSDTSISHLTAFPDGSIEVVNTTNQAEVDQFLSPNPCNNNLGIKVVDLTCKYYCNEINSIRDTKYAENNFIYLDTTWQTTPDKQALITARALTAKGVLDGNGGDWDGPYLYYKDLANNKVSFLTPQSFIDFAFAFGLYCASLASIADDYKEYLVSITNDPIKSDTEKITEMDNYYNDIVKLW